MFGVSHGAIQFMTYEEMKNKYNEYRMVPIDTKMVSAGNGFILDLHLIKVLKSNDASNKGDDGHMTQRATFCLTGKRF